MRLIIAIVIVCALCVSALAGGLYEGPLLVTEDSSGSATWTIGAFTTDTSASVGVDYDTSIVYQSHFWDNMTMQAKFRPHAIYYDSTGAADSGGVVIVIEVSNDELSWTQTDSLVVADSLPAFKSLTLVNWQYTRFVGHNGAGTDSAGVTGTVLIGAHGQK